MSVDIHASDFTPGSIIDLTKMYGHFINYTINGTLPANTTVIADGSIYLTGDIEDSARVYARGLINVGGTIGDHTILHGFDINAKHCGSNNDLEAMKGDIALLDAGDHNHLKAKGFISLENAGDYLHATIDTHGSCKDSELAFRTTGTHAVLKAPYVKGLKVGSHSSVTATEDRVTLGYIGDNSHVFSAAPAAIKGQGTNISVHPYKARHVEPQPSLSSYTLRNGFTPQGGGIYFNIRQSRYIISEETSDRCGWQDKHLLVDTLREHVSDLKTETLVAKDGRLQEETSFSLPKSNQGQQSVRKIIRDFANAHREIGENSP